MRVCDICKDGKLVKSYTLPMKIPYFAMVSGKIIDNYDRYEDREIDLCPTCQHNIAELLADMKWDYEHNE